MRKVLFSLCMLSALLCLSGCEDPVKKDQASIDKVKQTVIPDCDGRTLDDLVDGLLQNPVWTLEKKDDKVDAVLLSGTLMGDALPQWMKDQKLMDITFRLPVDPNGMYDPKALSGFPSLTTPEGVLQAYRIVRCE